MKKIVWLCNVAFSDTKIAQTGTWLQPLAEALVQQGNVQLFNITLGNTRTVQEEQIHGIKQWVLPAKGSVKSHQIASEQVCKQIEVLLNEIQPDLVHIWGTEHIWASVYQQGYINFKTLLDIQGLIFAYTPYFYGGLTLKEQLLSIHLKEVLMPWRTLYGKKKVFRKRGEHEVQIINAFKHIAYQSDWVYNQVKFINQDASFYPTGIVLREGFYTASPWTYKQNLAAPVIFSSTSAAVSYKGFHVLIKAISLLKTKYPRIQLRLAGNMHIGNKLLDGYSVFLNNLIRKEKLEKNIVFAGSLNEDQIISELQECAVCVVPSFIETYCLAFAEAMMIGVPTVVSFAGAMPEFAEHDKDVLFYNSLDHVTCAAYIDRLIQNQEKAELLSENARMKRIALNDRTTVLNNQLTIYNSIIHNDTI